MVERLIWIPSNGGLGLACDRIYGGKADVRRVGF